MQKIAEYLQRKQKKETYKMGEDEKKEAVAEEKKATDEPKPESVKEDASKPEPQKAEEESGASEADEDQEKPWKNERNARYAEMRRRNEELQKRIAQLESENRDNITDGVLKELGFSRTDLEDADTMEVAKAYMKGLANGVENPKAYAYESLYRNKREAERQAREKSDTEAQARAKEEAAVKADIESFRKKFPNEDIREVADSNSDFMKAFGSVVTNGNVTKYYEIYRNMKGASKKIDEAEKNRSNPTIVGNQGGGADGEYITEDEIYKLSGDKFDEAMRKVRSGKLKLRH